MPAPLVMMPTWLKSGPSPVRLAAAAWLIALVVVLAATVWAGPPALPGWLLALAMLLCTGCALLAGVLWGRQQLRDQLQNQLQDARQQAQLLGQLVDVWCWQTDAQHRLVQLQPPPGAPAAAWAAGALHGGGLWQYFDDAAHSLQARLQAQAALGELQVTRVTQVAQGPSTPARAWRLRGLPRLDSHGQFAGHSGVAWPSDDDQTAAACQLLDVVMDHSLAVLCIGAPAADGQGWQLARASPGARELLGLPGPDGHADTAALPWPQALAGLPNALRQQVLALRPGASAEADGWRAQLHQLQPLHPLQQLQLEGPPDSSGGSVGPACQGQLLLVLARADTGPDHATQALAAEHAAFSYTISHDLRAPIRVVEGFGRILKEDYGAALDRVGRDHIDRVLAAAARMNHMIDALLSLSRLSSQPLARQPVNLSQLATYVIDELRRSAPERQVSVHIAPGMVAQGDPTLLRMALENLLGNAWKYSAKMAQAVLRFEPEVHDGRPGFVISDNGAGFDMRFSDRLFGVFQRLHSSSDFQGTGVGLASVRRIVRRHGGEIWADSAVGQGARFHFRLQD